MKKTIYISGSISGDPDYKAKFAEAEWLLKLQGYAVLNPAVLPSEGFTYEQYMRIGIAMLMECESICLLPCYENSEGAKYEYGIAIANGKKIIMYEDLQ